MPRVGSKKFAYTPKGEAAAKQEAKRSGKKLKKRKRYNNATHAFETY
jgi:hypothetical protein